MIDPQAKDASAAEQEEKNTDNNHKPAVGNGYRWPGTDLVPVVWQPPVPASDEQATDQEREPADNQQQSQVAIVPLGRAYARPGGRGSPLVYRPPPPKPKKKGRTPWIYLSDKARRNGLYIVAGRGSGKSRLMGRVIAWQDFIRKIPQVIFDPVGSTISNLIDKIVRLPPHQQEQLWPRILYIDMSGELYGRVFPFPLYYRLAQSDSYHDMAWRFLEVLLRLDPKLQEAPIQGWNAIVKVGAPLGMVLSALGWQITEAQAFLANPLRYERQLRQVAAASNDRGLGQAVAFFTEQEEQYWASADWRRLKESFETKIAMFTQDNTTMAMFGATRPAFDWQEVVEKRMTVLLDFRGEHNRDLRRFKMLWVFLYFYSWLKMRGEGRHTNAPISCLVDEVSALYNFDTQAGGDIFAADLDELINVWARNANCWLTLCQQERWQTPSERAQKTLWSLGTKIIGNTSDHESALQTAQDLVRYDPYLVKRYERQWMMDPLFHNPFVVDQNPVEFTLEEQQLLASYKFKDLGLFQFYIKQAKGEGDVTGELKGLNIANLDKGIWPNEALGSEARRQLSVRSGLVGERVLKELEVRLEQPLRKAGQEGATLTGDDQRPDHPTDSEDRKDHWDDY